MNIKNARFWLITVSFDSEILLIAKQIAPTWLQVSERPAVQVQCAQIILPSRLARIQTCDAGSFNL